MKRFAIILAGCGVFDGAEIHEATLTMYAIASSGNQYCIFAPNIPQHHVVNHLTGEETNESRNVLVESARIARGKIQDISEFSANNFDGLIFPGGFGVAKNLSNWAFKEASSDVIPEIKTAINEMVKEKKPIGALCIAPVLLAKTLGNVELTIGNDPKTIMAIEAIGSKHTNSNHGEVVIDKRYKLVTTPCYMLEASISQIGDGAKNVVKAMLNLM